MTPYVQSLKSLIAAIEVQDSQLKRQAQTKLNSQWDTSLDGVRTAIQHGDVDSALTGLLEIIDTRQIVRELSHDRVCALDIDLLEHTAFLLQSSGRTEAALTLFGIARDFAVEGNDQNSAKRFSFAAVHCAIDLLDLESAGEILTTALTSTPDNWLDTASSVGTEWGGDILAFNAIGRLLAARGKLSTAIAAYSEALMRAECSERSLVSPEDLRTILAELRLDRAEFDEIAKLGIPTDSLTGRLLAAEQKRMRGYFSDAVALARGILNETDDSVIRHSTAMSLVQSLIFLNRPDEATQTLADIHPVERGFLLELIRIRRHEAEPAVPPAPGLWDEPPPASGDTNRSTKRSKEIDNDIRRTHERVRYEWAKLLNRARIYIQQGNLAYAIQIAEILQEWNIESVLFEVRRDLLSAWILMLQGRFRASQKLAEEIRDLTIALDLIPDALEASQIVINCMMRLFDVDVLDNKVANHAFRLIAQIQSRLTHRDGLLYGLNKWRIVDNSILQICNDVRTKDTPPEDAVTFILKERNRIGDNEPQQVTPVDLKGDAFSIALRAPSRRSEIERRDRPTNLENRRSLPSDLAVLVYAVLPTRIEAFVVTKETCHLAPSIEGTKQNLWHHVQTVWNRLMFEPWNSGGRLAALSRLLCLDTMCKQLGTHIRRLVIVPDDIISHIPFAGLPFEGAPLIDRFSIALMPHPRWVGWDGSTPKVYRRAVAVGVEHSSAEPELPRLTAVRRLKRTMQAAFGSRSHTYVDKHDTTQNSIKAALQKAALAEFACHGDYNPTAPERSGLLAEDGWMTDSWLAEISAPHLDMVSVGACFGADVTILPGSQQVGVPASLMVSGARVVLSALWPVDDNRAADMSEALYKRIESDGPISGLADIQREWRHKYDPIDWAGYTIHIRGIRPRGFLGWRLRFGDWLRHLWY